MPHAAGSASLDSNVGARRSRREVWGFWLAVYDNIRDGHLKQARFKP